MRATETATAPGTGTAPGRDGGGARGPLEAAATTFAALHPVLQALLAAGATWALTAVGAATVFATRTVDRRLLAALLGFAAGVMLAASYWSLLAPAVELASVNGDPPWLPAAGGFLAGAIALGAADRLLPHLHPGLPRSEAEGAPTAWHRSTLLVLAITLHNVPEGLAVGVAFGAVAAGVPAATLGGAVALAIGIGLQNVPEGMAVAMPLRGHGVPRLKSFWYGQLSAVVEPLFAVVGAAFVLAFRPVLPWALAFAAGAMVYVVIEEVVPGAQRDGHGDLATAAAVAGFVVMMVLDVGLSG